MQSELLELQTKIGTLEKDNHTLETKIEEMQATGMTSGGGTQAGKKEGEGKGGSGGGEGNREMEIKMLKLELERDKLAFN